ncbi:MAG: DUF3488 and transglutaminase-like domain-containing protein [Acidimicrobiales bacterium]
MTATLTPPSAPAEAAPARPTRSARPRIREGGPANIAIGALTLASVVGLGRLFVHPAPFLWPVALTAVVVHAASWQCRRARLSLLPSAAIAAVAATLCVAWTVFGHTTAFGLPWRGTLHAARLALTNASDVYRNSAPPAPAIPGFVLAGAFGAATAAFLADWAAFRMRATTEACLPSFSLFVLSCALAQGHHVVLAATVWFAALLCFLLARQPALDGGATAWFASRDGRGPGSVLTAGVALVAVAVGLIALLGEGIPGATVKPVINWRHQTHNTGGRNTGSPLVDIKARLHDQSQQEVFTVAAARPVYWRLTALDNFDGSGWSLNDTYQRAGTALPPGPTAGSTVDPAVPLHSDFRIGALSSIWLPAAYRPVHMAGARRISYSAEASSLITDQATSDGLAYSIDSEVPTPSVTVLRNAPRADPTDGAVSRYLQLPRSVPPSALSVALRQTRGARTPYDAALMLQDWFRGPTFRYSLDVPPDDSQDALVNFLTRTHAGFCQQFAGAYAVLARELGLPARVAVGFTPGDIGADGLWHVRDANAHAWPEVYFPGSGWVAFEPTPGRGSPDPNAQAVTGVTPPPPPAAPVTIAPPTTTAQGGASPTTPPGGKDRSLDQPQTAAVHHHHPHTLLVVLGVVLAAPLVWALALAGAGALLAARRRARATDVRSRVRLAWGDAREALTRERTAPRASETPAEYARRAARSAGLAEDPRLALHKLAQLVEVSEYAAAEPDPDQAVQARDAAGVVAAAARAGQPWWIRAARTLDPRPVKRALLSLRA